jgi:hypothetical protein
MLRDVVVDGGDFSFGFRQGARETAGAERDGHHHFPHARRLRVGWRVEDDGHWTYDREDEHLWEVLCAECGDTDGPSDNQREPARRLRGPYASEHKAKHTASRHFDEN